MTRITDNPAYSYFPSLRCDLRFYLLFAKLFCPNPQCHEYDTYYQKQQRTENRKARTPIGDE